MALFFWAEGRDGPQNAPSKMARLRFPGCPGQRIGRNVVTYEENRNRLQCDPSLSVVSNIQRSLSSFYELFGASDEVGDILRHIAYLRWLREVMRADLKMIIGTLRVISAIGHPCWDTDNYYS